MKAAERAFIVALLRAIREAVYEDQAREAEAQRRRRALTVVAP